jgi:hypothetical protein
MEISSRELKRIASDLANIPCPFNMCSWDQMALGGSKWPISGKTCIKCWAVWELRRIAEGKTRKEMDDMLDSYEVKFQKQLKKTY